MTEQLFHIDIIDIPSDEAVQYGHIQAIASFMAQWTWEMRSEDASYTIDRAEADGMLAASLSLLVPLDAVLFYAQESDNTRSGFCYAQFLEDDRMHLDLAYVREPLRGRRRFGSMIDAAIKLAHDRGIKTISAQPAAQGKFAGISARVLARHGFRQSESEPAKWEYIIEG